MSGIDDDYRLQGLSCLSSENAVPNYRQTRSNPRRRPGRRRRGYGAFGVFFWLVPSQSRLRTQSASVSLIPSLPLDRKSSSSWVRAKTPLEIYTSVDCPTRRVARPSAREATNREYRLHASQGFEESVCTQAQDSRRASAGKPRIRGERLHASPGFGESDCTQVQDSGRASTRKPRIRGERLHASPGFEESVCTQAQDSRRASACKPRILG